MQIHIRDLGGKFFIFQLRLEHYADDRAGSLLLLFADSFFNRMFFPLFGRSNRLLFPKVKKKHWSCEDGHQYPIDYIHMSCHIKSQVTNATI